MSISLRLSASGSGARNTFDRTVNFVSTYGGVSGGSKATNDAALSAFNTAYAAFSGRTQLVIPPGDYDFTGATWAALGGDKLTITATGATLRNQGGFTNTGQYNDNAHHANISTVSAGASTVSLVTPAQTSRFTSGQWVVVTEGDLQGFGYPSNPWKFEFKQIQSIGSGTLTFTAPLEKAYSSTYPNYSAGTAFDLYRGGPATVYALNPIWNQEIELVGAYVVDNGNLFYGKCRVAKYTDCTFETYGPCPTVNVLCVIRRCTTLGTELEVDKMVQRLEIYNNTFHSIVFQNASVNELVATDNTVAPGWYWRGVAGGHSTITNLNADTFWFGVKGYGVATGNATLTNVVSTTASYDTSYRFLFSNYTETGGGTLTITSASPEQWAVPGAYCVLTDASGNFNSISFQVTSVAYSGGVTTISTTLSYPVPATSGGRSAPWYIVPHPGKDTTLTGCTGNSVFTTASGNPPNSPIFGWA